MAIVATNDFAASDSLDINTKRQYHLYTKQPNNQEQQYQQQWRRGHLLESIVYVYYESRARAPSWNNTNTHNFVGWFRAFVRVQLTHEVEKKSRKMFFIKLILSFVCLTEKIEVCFSPPISSSEKCSSPSSPRKMPKKRLRLRGAVAAAIIQNIRAKFTCAIINRNKKNYTTSCTRTPKKTHVRTVCGF